MWTEEERKAAFRNSDTSDRATLIFQAIRGAQYRVWSRKELAEYFGVSKPVIDRPIAMLVAEGLLEEARYQRPNRKHILDWYFGYVIPMHMVSRTKGKA